MIAICQLQSHSKMMLQKRKRFHVICLFIYLFIYGYYQGEIFLLAIKRQAYYELQGIRSKQTKKCSKLRTMGKVKRP